MNITSCLPLVWSRANTGCKTKMGIFAPNNIRKFIACDRPGRTDHTRLDFKLILTHLVQKIIAHKMRQSSVGILAMPPRFIVMNHFHNVWAWTEMLSHAAEQNVNYKVPPTRTFDFSVDKLLEPQHDKDGGGAPKANGPGDSIDNTNKGSMKN